MNALFAMLAAAIPNALMAIAAKLLGETFVQAMLEKIIIFALKKAATLSTNTVDDALVADIEKRLQGLP